MFGSLAQKLGPNHEHFHGLRRACVTHAQAGLHSALSADYMASHWLGTFASYLLIELDGFLGWEESRPGMVFPGDGEHS